VFIYCVYRCGMYIYIYVFRKTYIILYRNMRRVEFRIDMCLIMRFGHIFDSKVNRGDGVGEEKKCPSGNSHDRLYGSKNIIRFGTTVAAAAAAALHRIYRSCTQWRVLYYIFLSAALILSERAQRVRSESFQLPYMYESGNWTRAVLYGRRGRFRNVLSR